MLAEIPDREIIVGAYTQPWREQVRRSIRCRRMSSSSFDEPGYTKIVWTLAAEANSGRTSGCLVTRTRVVAETDQESRRKHVRRYWTPMLAGILLIRYVTLPMVRPHSRACGTARRGLTGSRIIYHVHRDKSLPLIEPYPCECRTALLLSNFSLR